MQPNGIKNAFGQHWMSFLVINLKMFVICVCGKFCVFQVELLSETQIVSKPYNNAMTISKLLILFWEYSKKKRNKPQLIWAAFHKRIITWIHLNELNSSDQNGVLKTNSLKPNHNEINCLLQKKKRLNIRDTYINTPQNHIASFIYIIPLFHLCTGHTWKLYMNCVRKPMDGK